MSLARTIVKRTIAVVSVIVLLNFAIFRLWEFQISQLYRGNNPRYCMTIVNNYTTYIFVYVTVVAYVFIPLFNLPVNVVTTSSLSCLYFPSVQTAPVHGRAYWCVDASLFFCVDPMTRLRPPGTNTVSNSSPTQYPPQGTVSSTSIQCTQLFCLNGFVSSISQMSS